MVQKLFSKKWIASSQKRKQRKYLFNAPLNIKHKLISASLSKELKKEHNIRSIPVRKGDTVKIMSGQFKDKTGKVSKVSLLRLKVYVDGATIKRRDGTDAMYPIHPSNLMITKLDLSDKAREEKVKSFSKKDKKVEAKKWVQIQDI